MFLPIKGINYTRYKEMTRVLRKLGKGRYCESWEVELEGRGRLAMKVMMLDGSRGEEEAAENEMVIMFRMAEMVSPNLPLVVGWRRDETMIQMLTAVAEGDYEGWLGKGRYSPRRHLAALYQILGGLCVLEEKVGLVHNDLHWGNVLCYTEDPELSCYHYIYRNADNDRKIAEFWVPLYGERFVVWDFGLSVRNGRPPHTAATKRRMYRDVDQIVGGTLEWPRELSKRPRLHRARISKALWLTRNWKRGDLRAWCPPALLFMMVLGAFRKKIKGDSVVIELRVRYLAGGQNVVTVGGKNDGCH